MEETTTEQPGRIGTLSYFPMNAQESAKSRMAVATPRILRSPRTTTIPSTIPPKPWIFATHGYRDSRDPSSMELWWSSRIVVSVVWRLPFETLLSIHGEVWQEGLAAHRVSLCTIQYLGNDTNLDA
ncbi:hypothetical protein E4U44_008273 [Claviceps purpurea]|nr:hypothetical protein E4U44_008273 [Claviceps purpurea]